MGGQVQGEVRPRLGPPARNYLRTSEGTRGHRPRCQADRTPCRDPGLGRHARRVAAHPRTRDGGVCRVLGAHRPPRRPAHRRHRAARSPRRHDDLLHHRRQWGVCGRHHQWRLQRDGQLQRHGRAGDARVHDLQALRAGHPDVLQPLCRRMGLGHGQPVSVDQAGRVALGRNAAMALSCTGLVALPGQVGSGLSSAT